MATNPLRLPVNNFVFQLNTCGYNPYATSSLTRGWICRSQMLLVLASAVIHRAESRGIHDHILLFQIRDPPNLEVQVPVFISPRNRVARLYPQTLDSIFVASYDSQGYAGSTLLWFDSVLYYLYRKHIHCLALDVLYCLLRICCRFVYWVIP
jgi:hypothetical protein